MDTKPGGDDFPWQIAQEEAWELQYEATAANADALTFTVLMSVENDQVVVRLKDDRRLAS